MCQGYSPQLAKGHPCPFCRLPVYDRRLHPEQCAVLYQVASQWLRAQSADAAHEQRTSKAVATAPASLHKFFGKSRTSPTSSTPVAPGAKVQSGAPSGAPTHGNGGREAARNTGHPGLRIRALSNTSNSCFANALIQALTAVHHRGFDLGQWQSVINQLVNSAESKPIGLFGMFEFHHLISGWRLDGQQHDVAAADFLAHLQRSLRDAWIP